MYLIRIAIERPVAVIAAVLMLVLFGAVALVKIADLATVGFGPAFWMFCGLVVLIVAQDKFMCKWSVWNSLENPKKS